MTDVDEPEPSAAQRPDQSLTPRLAIILVTSGTLVAAFWVTVFWFVQAAGIGRFEPAVSALALLAGITGIVAERYASAKELREQALSALHDELITNQRILDSPPFTPGAHSVRREVYPRLYSSALESALLSTALSPRRDRDLVSRLHHWRNTLTMFNHRLDIAEIMAFLDNSGNTARHIHQGLHRDHGTLQDAREVLADLSTRVPAFNGRR
jgi:hypothetical protein